MPTISAFHGITIYLYWFDHNPPHFHARYQGYEATFRIDGSISEGYMPEKQCKMILEWAAARADELSACWNAAARGGTPATIEPLR